MADVLNLKLKYSEKVLKETRQKYRNKKKDLEELFTQKERKFRSILGRITRISLAQRKKGVERQSVRVRWWKAKFSRIEMERPGDTSTPAGGLEDLETGTQRMAEVSGARRPRIKVQVPVHGDIEPPLDEEELDFMRLPPKFNMFPKVTTDDVIFQHSIR